MCGRFVSPDEAAIGRAWRIGCRDGNPVRRARMPASARRTKLINWVRRDLAERFSGRLLPIDVQVAERWGMLVGESERRGVPLPVIDSLLAATALVHGLEIVTRNVRDFERCGVTCVDLWGG